jgi:hypothetical protein
MRTSRGFALPFVASLVAFAAPLISAAPAAAQESDYLRVVLSRFAYLNAEQSLAQGNKICAVTRSGVPAADAVIMTTKDLQVSVPAAYDIVNAAVVHLC